MQKHSNITQEQRVALEAARRFMDKLGAKEGADVLTRDQAIEMLGFALEKAFPSETIKNLHWARRTLNQLSCWSERRNKQYGNYLFTEMREAHEGLMRRGLAYVEMPPWNNL